MFTIAVFVGSLRKESINKKFAYGLKEVAKDKLLLNIVSLDDIPMFNQDWEQNQPEPVLRLKQAVAEADGALFVMPEYNRGIPAVLKNAIDWCSRPYGKSVWPGKPAAIAGATYGAIGTAVGQSHLRSVITVLGMCVMAQPEMYITWNDHYVDAQGRVADEKNRAFLGTFVTRFSDWIDRHGVKK